MDKKQLGSRQTKSSEGEFIWKLENSYEHIAPLGGPTPAAVKVV